MIADFWKILPLFIAEYLAKKYCERVKIGNQVFVIGFETVLFKLEEEQDNEQ